MTTAEQTVTGHDIVVVTEGDGDYLIARELWIDGHRFEPAAPARVTVGGDMPAEVTLTLLARTVRFISEAEAASTTIDACEHEGQTT